LVREDLQDAFVAYQGYLGYAAFYYQGTLYTVEIQMDAPPNKAEGAMVDLCNDLLKEVVMGMLPPAA
jgi:hypothetical protein